MKERGLLIRNELPDELRRLVDLREAFGTYGKDADAQGKDNMGQNSRIPWVRWYSKSRSPSATQGWYVVYLFHPDASGVSLCLSHGSTNLEGSALVQKSDAEVAVFMDWASGVVGKEFAGDASVRRGIKLGSFDLARAYERTTVFSKFYPAGRGVPDDEVIRADLTRFVALLAKLYRAQELGHEPGATSPDLLAIEDAVQSITAPLKPPRKGQGRGLTGPLRKLVEYEAMRRARQWLQDEGFKFKDVSAVESCDFRAQRHGDELVVEVKGTTGGPESVLLTANEVALHQSAYPRNALLVVHGIVLSEDGTSVLDGGELLAVSPWAVNEERLKPVCYEYRLD